MSEITLEQIDKCLSEIKYGEPISIEYNDFSVMVKTILTEIEKGIFVERVIENSYINNIEYSPISSRVAFIVTFAQIFTNLPIPTKEIDSEVVIDTDKVCSMINGLDIITLAKGFSKEFANLLGELEMCIKQAIDFKNQKLIAIYAQSTATDEAIETFSSVMNKAVDLLNVAIDQVEKNGNKIFKNLTPKKISEWVSGLQKTVADSIKSSDGENGSNIVNIENFISKQENKEDLK